MADLPPKLHTGEIIRHYREKRGVTRAVLAHFLGYSTDWLKRIERGDRGISLPSLLQLARFLRVDDLATFIDGDVPIPVSSFEGRSHSAVAAVRQIIHISSFSLTNRGDEPPGLNELAEGVAEIWRAWHLRPDNHTVVAEALPPLIRDLEQATILFEGQQRRAAHRELAIAYGLAQHLAVDLVPPGDMRVLVDRTVRAAQAADEPVSLAFAAWIYGHSRRNVDPDGALRSVSTAARQLEDRLDDEHVAGLYGSLNLHCAVSAAGQGSDGIAWRYWDTAEKVARRLPTDYFHSHTVFGIANVALHGVSIAAELRRHGEAVQRADQIDPRTVPSVERRGRLFGELAASYLHRAELDGALHFLTQAYETAPERAAYSPLTRGAGVELVRSARGPLKTAAVALAERMGVLPSV
jgi:transcriptional regulator with XRE-family HTH domain